MISRHKYSGILLCFLLCSVSAPAQEPPIRDSGIAVSGDDAATEQTAGSLAPARQMDPALWDSLTRDKAFFYRDATEQAQKIKKSSPPGAWRAFFERIIVFLLSTSGQILFWSALLLILGYVIYRILKGEVSFIWTRREKRKDTATDTTGQLSEEDLLSTDWQEQLQRATEHNDRRQATRYALLHILQRLQAGNRIRYRMDKTNYDYFLELQQAQQRDLFRRLVLAYEIAWFGRFTISDIDWQAIQEVYQQLKNTTTA